MRNNFLENYRDSVGITYGPLWNLPGYAKAPFKAKVLPKAYINYDTQNSGIDKSQVPVSNNFSTDTVKIENRGADLLEAQRRSPIAVTPSKILWRLDGRTADTNEYNKMLSSVKNELLNSKSYEDTARILNKYAKNWTMNMYILGTEDGRANGSYDWSPANFFVEKINGYNGWKDLPEAPDEYPNSEWVEDIINGIDDSLTLDKKIHIPAERIKLV